MARGENPGELLLIPTTLTYDRNVAYGHASAGKDLALSIIEATGATQGQAQLAADGDRVLGKFVELHADGRASYMPVGFPMIFRKDNSTIVPGQAIRGAGAGKVKSDVTAASRGRVIQILEAGDNGRILVLFP